MTDNETFFMSMSGREWEEGTPSHCPVIQKPSNRFRKKKLFVPVYCEVFNVPLFRAATVNRRSFFSIPRFAPLARGNDKGSEAQRKLRKFRAVSGEVTRASRMTVGSIKVPLRRSVMSRMLQLVEKTHQDLDV